MYMSGAQGELTSKKLKEITEGLTQRVKERGLRSESEMLQGLEIS